MLRLLSQRGLRGREGLQPDDSAEEGAASPSPSPKACPTAPAKPAPHKGRAPGLLLSLLLGRRERQGTCCNPLGPSAKAGVQEHVATPSGGQWESSREGRKWEEQIIYIKKVTEDLKLN